MSARQKILNPVEIELTCVRTHIMKELAEYTTDEKEKEMLLSMATTTPEGKELYKNWVQDSCRHITAILEDLPSCKPPIGTSHVSIC